MNGHSIHKITHNALPYLDPRFSPGSLTPPAAEQPRSLCPPPIRAEVFTSAQITG
ncbi:hypothetical protein BIFBIF_01632 [Bifidobacterium bifidum ATCC 29521 = JCM 1255 = DSM 20456]|nr:hypothetical protein BIFBIF_01632 [Bifidobacterium bifidum ATCC 29521 = JCM 1255 = DSM 20456]